MSMYTITEGRIAQPELRFTSGQNRPVLELRICATRPRKDKQNGDWGDDGEPLWVSASFWDQEAERLADTLQKGDTITVTGDLVVESYTAKDGTQRDKHVIRFPRFRGAIPRNPQQGQTGTHQFATAANGTSPVPVDPWTAQGPQNGTQAPSQAAPF